MLPDSQALLAGCRQECERLERLRAIDNAELVQLRERNRELEQTCARLSQYAGTSITRSDYPTADALRAALERVQAYHRRLYNAGTVMASALRARHHGRMPDEVRTAYEALWGVITEQREV